MQFRNHTLENGLEIIAECNENAHSMAVGFFVKTGARDEADDNAGVSHFLEHMAFKGTSTRTANEVNLQFDEMGAHYNAYTTEESTVYYAAVLPEKQEESVTLLADILRPSLREEDFNMEKEVIIEEIQMYMDQPPFGADDMLKELYFEKHPLHRSVLGTVDSVRSLSVEQMRDYFNARYSPGNVFLAAAGKVDFDKLVTQLEECCGEWPVVETHRQQPDAPAKAAFQSVCQETATQQYILQIANAPKSSDESRYAAKILSTILGDDAGSRIYWDLVDNGVAEHASLGHYEYQGVGIYYTWASCTPAQTGEVLGRIQAIYGGLKANPITQEELDQAKSKVKARVVLGSERPRSRLFSLGGNWLQRREHRSIAQDLAAVESVSLEQLHALCAEFPLDQCTTLTIGPEKEVLQPA